MATFDQLVGRLTERLRADPELRMDVAAELRSHLEDAAAEFRGAGQSQEEAAASAVKALGDERQLAEQLWQANRRRIGFRRAAKWSARVTLVPGAILVTLLVIAGFSFQNLSRALSLLRAQTVGFPDDPWREHADAVTPDKRFLFVGDGKVSDRLGVEKAIADRWPDNPTYYANYVSTYLGTSSDREGLARGDPAAVARALPILDRGEKLDPNNAFYNVVKAALLMRLSSKVQEDANTTYRYSRRGGPPEKTECWRVEIHDAATFDRALAELRLAAGKERLTDHAMDMLQCRLDALPPPRRLSQYLYRVQLCMGTLFGGIGELREVVRGTSAYALELARQGRRDEAERLLREAQVVAAKSGAEARTTLEVLSSKAAMTTALGHAARAYEAMKLPEEAAKAQERLAQEDRFWESVWSGAHGSDQNLLRQAGFLHSLLMPALPGYRPELEPMRSAEYAVGEQTALAILLALLVLLAIALGAATLVSALRFRGRENGPMLLFAGWKRLGRICLIGIVLPLGAYVAYAHLTSLGRREEGLGFAGVRFALECLLVGLAMLVLVVLQAFRAIRGRAHEAGMAVPAAADRGGQGLRSFRWFAALGIAVALAVCAFLVAWPFAAGRPGGTLREIGTMLWLALAGYGLLLGAAGLVRLCRLRGQFAHFRRTVIRSMAPILAAAVIVVGMFCGLALWRAESSAVERIRGAASLDFQNEVELSNFRLVRDRFTQEHRAMMVKAATQRAGAHGTQAAGGD